MSYHRPTHGRLGEHYGSPGSSPRLIAPVLGGVCGVGGFALGSDAKMTQLKLAKGDEVSLYDKLNLDISRALAPFKAVVQAMPLSTSDKSKLLGAPLTFVIDIFDPFEDAIGRACDRVISQKGKMQKPFWLLGGSVNVARVQSADTGLDSVTKNIVKRLRTANAFIVLCNTQPIEMIVECAREGLNVADGMRRALGLQGLAGYGGGLGEAAAATGLTALLASLGLSAELSAAIMAAIGALVTAAGGALAAVIVSGGEAAAASLLPKPTTTSIRSTSFTARPLTTTTAPPPKSTPVKIGPASSADTRPVSSAPTVAIFAGVAALAFLVVRARKRK